jgi:hypothetical protein
MERYFVVNHLPPFEAPVTVAPSKHGKGLFATRDIEPDEMITRYPCHYIKEVGLKTDEYYLLKHPDAPPPWSSNIDEHHEYAFDAERNEDYSYSIVADPSRPVLPWLACHFANDCVDEVMSLKRFATPNTLARNWIKYDRITRKRRNAVMRRIEDVVELYSVKKINEGEEVLTSYGFPYWLGKSNDELKRILQKADPLLISQLVSSLG